MAISMEKVQEQAPELVSLAKKAQFSLQKRDLDVTKAKVALVLDYSGSMYYRYDGGEVQRLAERVLALATQLDDDGEVDVFLFEDDTHYAGTIKLDDYQGAVQRLIQNYRMGSTDYAGAFKEVTKHFFPGGSGLFKKRAAASDEPVFAVFITDGQPNSRSDAEKELIASANHPIFWKMFSVGEQPIDFLQKLDDLKRRKQDNADCKHVGDVDGVPDMQLFDMLLDEYPEFIQSSKSLGMLA